jgi:hypothetical protein
MHMRQGICQPGCLVQVLQAGVAVIAGIDIDDAGCRAAGAHMNLVAGKHKVMTLGLAAKRHLARQGMQAIIDQAFGKQQAPAVRHRTTCVTYQLDNLRRGLRHANAREDIEGGLLYRFSIGCRQRHEPATLRHDAP